MCNCFFVSDLHGRIERYEKLFSAISRERPEIVFIGGDILPHGLAASESRHVSYKDFFVDYLVENLNKLKDSLGKFYPHIFLILGNDDERCEESSVIEADANGILEYINNKKVQIKDHFIYGYAYVPPTPFMLKDWEKYDVSRYVDPGCIPPEEGRFTVHISAQELKYSTIKKDLEDLLGNEQMRNAVFLFHSPPYNTNLDHAALDGVMIDSAPLDPHVGSIAIRQMIENKQPYLTMHGHIHESVRLSGSWKDRIGSTICFSAAHDGKELAVIKFDLDYIDKAARVLI
jgi:Icc-related predicted phosphoesterase